MSQPYWITPAGSLGTIPEGVFYSIPLQAIDPAVSVTPTIAQPTGGIVTFRFATQTNVLFPLGTSVVLEGFVPDVYNGTYEVIRTSKNSVGLANDSIEPVTVFGTISHVPVTVTYEVVAGQLPAGFAINEYGVIAGSAKTTLGGIASDVSVDTTSRFAIRARNQSSLADRTFTVTVAVLNQPYFVTPAGNLGTYVTGDQIMGLAVDVYNPDIYGVTIVRLVAGALPPGLTISAAGIISGVIGTQTDPDYTYNFTLEVTNGQSSNLREFNLFVYARQIMTADTTYITADNTLITADIYNESTPVMLTPPGNIGATRTGNFFAFQFTAVDPNVPARPYEFVNLDNNLPPGLSLDPATGWFYGLLPSGNVGTVTYPFTVQVRDVVDTFLISPLYTYKLTVVGPVSSDIVWITPGNLGTIVNGSTSTLYVEAQSLSGFVLQYQLAGQILGDDPVYNLLPQGLQLLPSGHIAGRVSFDTFALDGGTTTFDRRKTTFDLTFTFTVLVTSTNGLVNALQTFTITVIRLYEEPYDNLYIQAMPPLDDRNLLNGLLQNDQIFPPNLIYRNDDPNFGVAQNVVYNHAYGLTAATLYDYVNSLNLNHYWKNLVLGEIKTAQALDDDGNVIYEVVYSEIVDDLVNNAGESVGQSVELPYAVDTGLGPTQTVYPNSLPNMRNQVIDTVGQVSIVLPRWMLSKQADGNVLGFTPAWVIAYTVPGQSGQVAYNIQTQFGTDRLNLIDFEVDRYELDNLLTKNWDREAQHWTPQPPSLTTFDFSIEQTTWINSLDPAAILPWVNNLGAVVGWSYGTPPGTTFDGGSLQFIAPVDMYSNTTEYDRYLVFPRRDIITPVGAQPLNFIPWTEDANTVTWVDDVSSSGPVTWTTLDP
jgi:Putative Ig domain